LISVASGPRLRPSGAPGALLILGAIGFGIVVQTGLALAVYNNFFLNQNAGWRGRADQGAKRRIHRLAA
jgi:hypothetical protein